MTKEELIKFSHDCFNLQDTRSKFLISLDRKPEEYHYYRFFYELCKLIRPNIVCEIGTFKGVSALHFKASYTKAKVYTIDIKYDKNVVN